MVIVMVLVTVMVLIIIILGYPRQQILTELQTALLLLVFMVFMV